MQPLAVLSIDWERVLNTYGWPTLILLVISIIVYKSVWPRITQYLDDQRQAALEARSALIKRTEKLEEREDNQFNEFTEILDGIKEALQTSVIRQDKQIELMSEVLSVSKETREITRETNNIAKGRNNR